MAYDQIALSIAAYEASPEVNAFSSKYDLTFTGKSKLTKLEQKGFALFRGKGKCKLCHVGDGQHALLQITASTTWVSRLIQRTLPTLGI